MLLMNRFFFILVINFFGDRVVGFRYRLEWLGDGGVLVLWDVCFVVCNFSLVVVVILSS